MVFVARTATARLTTRRGPAATGPRLRDNDLRVVPLIRHLRKV